jgi:hypothetical protein
MTNGEFPNDEQMTNDEAPRKNAAFHRRPQSGETFLLYGRQNAAAATGKGDLRLLTLSPARILSGLR